MNLDAEKRWNELHSIPKFSPRYPSELVVRWTFRNFPRDLAASFSLLDNGAGGGRHAIFWAREGYRATAADFSPLAVRQTKEWASAENLKLSAVAAPSNLLPFEADAFDGLLSFGVLYYLNNEQMSAAVSEMKRVLKPGGKAFVMMKSDADSRAIHGEKIATHSYRVRVPDPRMHWAAEEGLTLTLLDREAVNECFADFSAVEIDRSSVTSGNGLYVDDEWLIQLRK